MTMSYEDYFKVEQPTFHVFTDEEIALGDLPEETKKEAPTNTREAKKKERMEAQ